MKAIVVRLIAACAMGVLFFFAVSLRAQLPPQAQEALKKGLMAAQQQDYMLAIRYFQDARKAAPETPEVFYNLGVAESKIPGRELRAIACFGAYLAAAPKAPNGQAVKDQIEALDVKSQSNLSHLLQTALDAATQIPETNIGRADGYDRNGSIGYVARLRASLGDDEAAQRILEMVPSNYEFRSDIEQMVAQAKARRLLSQTAPAVNPREAVSISDWAKLLDAPRFLGGSPLSTINGKDYNLDAPFFLDLPGYLKSLPPAKSPKEAFDALMNVAWAIA